MMDSDSDISLGISAEEEEELLLRLASQFPPPSLTPTDPALVVDTLPRKLDTISGRDAVEKIEKALAPGTPKPVAVTHSSALSHNPAALANSEELPSPFSIQQDISYPNLSNALSRIGGDAATPPESFNTKQLEQSAAETSTAANQKGRGVVLKSEDDGSSPLRRSPLQLFRTFPKKPLSVSDLTSGAWCELQYWYTLTTLPGGRRTRTAAMRQGSKVHQKLEDEVHTTVRIEIMTKEDGFGLRLWNLIQGLRTLRDTGLTRELEVWGLVDGNLVNGVIDGLSYENPNPEFEEELARQSSQNDPRQSTLADYFPSQSSISSTGTNRKIYLTDVKTRGSTRPVSASMLRPSKIQLLLYHRFLSEMAARKLDFFRVFRRYGLDPDLPFSDTFIAQIASLHDEVFVDAPTSPGDTMESTQSRSTRNASGDEGPPGLVSTEPDLIRFRSLRELLSLVDSEVAQTFPDSEDSVGHMLRVQYVHRSDGRELDVHDFPVSRRALDEYLKNYMNWWRGERDAKGVDMEEAFKCQICEFSSSCSWRQEFDEDRVQKARNKIKSYKYTPKTS
ncbi:hypothetical protein S7711_05515 [Stachybotrys chartarum IBT 7711]|uniref:Exonuclease V n=1 Tax=Stachybotrys chartarum (strain CBS 109288 / IBT 7711) TaxID=1280523 RepID=A0A084AS26_STACB|nr:hypothetical protein S7711_05515 [Stachybotrys chartarum IBT 7711]